MPATLERSFFVKRSVHLSNIPRTILGCISIGVLLIFLFVQVPEPSFACVLEPDDYPPFLDILPADFVFSGQSQKLFAPFAITTSEWEPNLQFDNVTREYNSQKLARYLGISPIEAESIVYLENYPDWLPHDVASYLRFVHETEPLVNRRYPWQRQAGPARTPEQANFMYLNALTRAQSHLAHCEDEFLRLRWFFITMRLAHYHDFFDIEEEIFQEHANSFSEETLAANPEVWLWIKALRAGMLQKTSNRPEDRALASFLFAEVYLNSHTKWDAGLKGFWIRSDEEWSHLASLCNSNDDLALMHFLRATQKGNFTLAELEKIAKISPGSEMTRCLLANELRYAHSVSDYYSNQPGLGQPWVLSYYNRFLGVLDGLKTQSGFEDDFLLNICYLYLEFFFGQGIEEQDIDVVTHEFPDDPRAKYLSTLRLAAFALDLDHIDASTESRLDYLCELSEDSVPSSCANLCIRFVLGHIAEIYASQGEQGKSLAAEYGHKYLEESLSENQLDSFLAFSEKGGLSAFETRLLRLNHFSPEYAEQQKVFHLLGSHRFDLAIERLKKMADVPTLDFDPFASGVRGNNREKSTRAYGSLNLLSYALLMQNLHSIVEVDDSTGWAHLRLANAYYNASHLGNSPYYLRGSLWADELPYSELDIETAKYYFRNTLAVTRNDELRAEALHGLAKIASASEDSTQNPGRFWEQSLLLRHTDYFREIIQECTVFKSGKW